MGRGFLSAAAVGLALGAGAPGAAGQPAADAADPVAALVGRLDLEGYKAAIKGLTQFGDRRQGTRRNRDAVDWIEAQLQAVGCATERVFYTYAAPPPRPRTLPPLRAGGAPQPLNPAGPTPTGGRIGRNGNGPGGSSIFGYRRRTGVVRDPSAQPDEALRALNLEEPVDGGRSQVFCTKIGSTRPDEMYILGAHMDGHGFGEAANDDGSGTALVIGTRAYPERPRRADRAVHPVRPLEQRGDRPERQPGLRGAAPRAAGSGRSPGVGPVSRAALAGDDPARHDAVRPRRARPGRRRQPRPAAGGRREHRVPVELGARGRIARPSPSSSRPPTTPTPPIIPPWSGRT